MGTLAVYSMIFLGAVTLFSAILGLANFLSFSTGGAKSTLYVAKLSGGVSYTCLGLAGSIACFFLEQNQIQTGILAALFFPLGLWMITSGLRLRRHQKQA